MGVEKPVGENTSDEVKISMLFEEYLEELRLIERQYGQEEALYPLVYMILKDSLKKNKNGNTQDLSMMHVPTAKSAKTLAGRELIKGYVGFPDLAIFSKDFRVVKDDGEDFQNIKHIYGCAEIKGLGDLLCDFGSIEEIKLIKRNNENKEQLDTENPTNQNNVNATSDSKDSPDQISLQINDRSEILFYKTYDKQKKKNIMKMEPAGQLLGELLWYGRVIYTNGLQWKYLEVTECQWMESSKVKETLEALRNLLYERCVKYEDDKWYEKFIDLQKNNDLKITIRCAEIGNLEDAYKKYKSNKIEEKNDEKMTKKNSMEWIELKSWDNLLANLKKINWTGTTKF